MATAADVLRVAASQVGTVEGPRSNEVRYNEWYYGRKVWGKRYPWCDVFVSWCMSHAGMPTHFAGTPGHVAAFRRARQWHPGTAGVRAGDVVFFDFPDKSTGVQHVGFVESVNPVGLVTLEGNTSGGPHGSQDNGGMVARRARTFGPYIVGFGRPPYAAASGPPVPTPMPAPHRRPRMILVQPDGANGVFLVFGRGNFVPIEDPQDRDAIIAAGVPLVPLKATTWADWRKAA